MKDIEDKLAKFLMEYGVLKNADADKMARKIAGMFEKEREELQKKLSTTETVLKHNLEHAKCSKCGDSNMLLYCQDCYDNQRAQLAAKCAQMRAVLSDAMIPWSMGKVWKIDMANLAHTISDSCGAGWLSPEKAQRLRIGLERMAGYAATVRLDRRKVIDGEVMCLQMEDWCNGLLERVEESQKALDETK